MSRVIVAIVFFVITVGGVDRSSASELNYNIVHLSQEVEKSVGNDLMTVELIARVQEESPQSAAKQVNSMMKWALSRVNQKDGIISDTRGYSTYPQYKNNEISSWSVQQVLHLESAQQDLLTSLVGELQEKLHVQHMGFSIQNKTRRSAVEELRDQAIKDFRLKSEHITQTMGGVKYKIVEISIDEGGGVPIAFSRAYQMEAVGARAVAPPAVQGGDSTVKVTVSGTIQIVYE